MRGPGQKSPRPREAGSPGRRTAQAAAPSVRRNYQAGKVVSPKRFWMKAFTFGEW